MQLMIRKLSKRLRPCGKMAMVTLAKKTARPKMMMHPRHWTYRSLKRSPQQSAFKSTNKVQLVKNRKSKLLL